MGSLSLRNGLLDLGSNSCLSLFVRKSEVSDPLLSLRVLLDKFSLVLLDLFSGRVSFLGGWSLWGLSDFSMYLLVESF